jgi:hypothetical protein
LTRSAATRTTFAAAGTTFTATAALTTFGRLSDECRCANQRNDKKKDEG